MLAIVAFSLTSFANEVENKNLATNLEEVATTELTNTIKDDACFDVSIKWTEVTSAGDSIEDGVIICFHEIEFTVCF